MIKPPGFRGAAFGDASDGNAKRDGSARRKIAGELGIGEDWATARQVHGAEVVEALQPGHLGDADAIFTKRIGLPMAVATADCYPVVLEAGSGVSVVHAGWRGTAAGVVGAARDSMERAGVEPERAAIGPGIGPCCYEVGSEVAARFPEWLATTTWGATSVDLRAAIGRQLEGLSVWTSDVCTRCGSGYHSHRRNRTPQRQVAVAWLPNG